MRFKILGSNVFLANNVVSVSLIWLLVFGQLFNPLTGTVSANPTKSDKVNVALSNDQRVLHVLNRLGYGVRPGELQKVKNLSLDRYIELQLHPGKIDDRIVEDKLKDFKTLSMSTAELFAKYPSPNILMKQLKDSGSLPPELEGLKEMREKGKKPAEEMSSNDTNSNVKEGKNEYRRALAQYYAENNLQFPQRVAFELQASRILRAVYSERQLQELMVDFWTNHFNVFIGKGPEKWLLVSYDRDTIRPNTMGKFHDLLLATAKSPAMLYYLDNHQSVSPNANIGNGKNNQRIRMRKRMFGIGMMSEMNEKPAQQKRMRRGINENYARELMELHTLGVDGGYTQKDVQEVARCFTGWTIINPRGRMNNKGGRLNQQGETGDFHFNPRLHDDGEKIVLGHKIPAGGGMEDGLKVLDILAKHPSTAKFIATKLCRRFVMDNPSNELVDRIASIFAKSNGDIRETLRAIFTSSQFNSKEAYRSKIKTPFELAISAIRTLGGDTNGGPQLIQWISRMGEPLYQYQAPTGYPDLAEAWVNTGGLLERLNFSLALASNSIAGTRIDMSQLGGTDAVNSVDKNRALEHFIQLILQGEISENTKSTLIKEWTTPSKAESLDDMSNSQMDQSMGMDDFRKRDLKFRKTRTANAKNIRPEMKLIGLILGTPEFQRQ
jgi:uncharacterized protein (DUF1800 family)